MWVVYMSAPYEGEWGHKYFCEQKNAQNYYEKKVKESKYSCVDIEEIETEDSPNGVGDLED